MVLNEEGCYPESREMRCGMKLSNWSFLPPLLLPGRTCCAARNWSRLGYTLSREHQPSARFTTRLSFLVVEPVSELTCTKPLHGLNRNSGRRKEVRVRGSGGSRTESRGPISLQQKGGFYSHRRVKPSAEPGSAVSDKQQASLLLFTSRVLSMRYETVRDLPQS